MIILGLFLAIASLPGYTSAAIPAGWAALSLTLPIVAWKSGVLSWAHAAMGLFLLYVFASIAWSTEPLDGFFRLWQFSLVAGCLWLGTVREPREILVGLALGYLVSSLVAAGQWFGWEFVLRYNWNHYPGLYFSGVFAGAIGAMLLVALLCEQRWVLAFSCVPGIALASIHSRGALVAGAVGMVATYLRRWWLIPIICTILAAYVILSDHNSDIERRAIWSATFGLLTWFGHGAGSFVDLVIITPLRIARAENAHNDLLQVWFEFGVGALPFIAVWAALCFSTRTKHWPVVACFTTLSVFFFPLYTPLTACIFALCAGATVRDRSSVSDLLDRVRRIPVLQSSHSPLSHSLST